MNKLFVEYVERKGNENGQSHDQKTLDPEPMKKWAEEGYAVAQVTVSDDRTPKEKFGEWFGTAMKELENLKECEGVEKVGLVGEYLPSCHSQSRLDIRTLSGDTV